MKRTIYNYIILTIATMLLAACSQDTLGELYSGDDETTTISFTLGTPAWTSNTRAGVAGDDVTSVESGKLQLLCFDANGGFVGVGSEVTSSSAKVPSGTRHIHFLLNYAKTITNTSFTIGTNEKTALTSLYTTASSSSSVLCWGYISDLSTYTSGTNIPLVRNVAKICINNKDTEKKTISGVSIVAYNDYKTGSVAPFDSKNLSNPFNSDNYSNGVPKNFVTIPLDAERQNTKGVSAMGTTDNVFVYECDQTLGEIGVIVAVKYNDNTTRYHKIRLCDTAGNLYTIARNHQYTINIDSDLPKSSGKSSLTDAIAVTSDNATNMITVDNEITWSAKSLSFVTNSGDNLLTLYPELDMTTSDFSEKKEAITKTVKFKYLGTSTDLTAQSFTVTSSVTDVKAEITSYSDHVGEIKITVPYSNLSMSSAGTITLTYGSNLSDVLTINGGTWSSTFTGGTINYYIDSDNSNAVVITGFTLTTAENAATSGTNLRVASNNLIPTSSSSFNNAYIDATPITGLEYWYNNPTTASISSSDFAFRGTEGVSAPSTEDTSSPKVYVMADGIKPCAVKWVKGEKPTKSYAYIDSYTKNNGITTFTLAGENSSMFTYSGNGTSFDNNYTINKKSIKYALKLESNAGAIKFTTSSQQTMTLYATANNAIKITDSNSGTITATSESVTIGSSTLYKYTATLPAGTYTISKGSNSGNVVYIELE